MKRTEENIAKQKKLNEIQLAEDRAERLAETEQRQSMNSKRAAGETIMGGSRGPSKRVREAPPEEVRRCFRAAWAVSNVIAQEDEYRKRPEIKIWIPDELKVQLVDDWEAITKSQKVRRCAALASPAIHDSTARAFAAQAYRAGDPRRLRGTLQDREGHSVRLQF